MSATGQRPDVPTALAIAVCAYVLAKVIHEGLGHGLTCVALGGKLIAVSSAWCDCERDALGVGPNRAIKAMGTLANLALGGAAFAALRAVRGWGHYALWLVAAVNLFMGAGYLMTDPLFHFGDWGAFLEGLPRPLGFVLSALGAGLTVGFFFALRPRLAVHLGAPGPEAVARARRLTLLPWLVVGGGFMTLAALRNVHGPRFAFTSGLATVGGTFMLVWLPLSFRAGKSALGSGAPAELPRSNAWLAVGLAVAAATLLWFGPGITFSA